MKAHKLKLSKIYANGSYLNRINTAKKINENLFSEIYSLFKNSDYVSIREIERHYKKNFPEQIYFGIKKLQPHEREKFNGCFVKYFYNNKITNYKILLPAKNNKLHISSLSTLMHESMHFLDLILTTKNSKISEKIREKHLEKIANDLYCKHYYNNKGYSYWGINTGILKNTKRETNKVLVNKSTEDKLLILNHIKESIKSEINAFNETYKYAKILKKDKRKHATIDANGYFKSYMFEKKLKIINNIISKIIKKERGQKTGKFYELINQIKKLVSLKKQTP